MEIRNYLAVARQFFLYIYSDWLTTLKISSLTQWLKLKSISRNWFKQDNASMAIVHETRMQLIHNFGNVGNNFTNVWKVNSKRRHCWLKRATQIQNFQIWTTISENINPENTHKPYITLLSEKDLKFSTRIYSFYTNVH